MTRTFTTRIVDEYLARKPDPQELAESVLETALYLEEVLGITITDAEMTVADLGSREAILALAERKSRGVT